MQKLSAGTDTICLSIQELKKKTTFQSFTRLYLQTLLSHFQHGYKKYHGLL